MKNSRNQLKATNLQLFSTKKFDIQKDMSIQAVGYSIQAEREIVIHEFIGKNDKWFLKTTKCFKKNYNKLYNILIQGI